MMKIIKNKDIPHIDDQCIVYMNCMVYWMLVGLVLIAPEKKQWEPLKHNMEIACYKIVKAVTNNEL